MALTALAPGNASAEEACPNAALRFGPSANLPDCRAYELVTPAVKEDNSLIFGAYGFADGEHVYFASILPLPGAKDGAEQGALSSRTPAGWITTPLTVAQGSGVTPNFATSDAVAGFTSDFSAAFVGTPFAADPRDQNIYPDVYRIDIPSASASIESLPDTGPMTEELYAPPPGVTYEGESTPQGSFVAGNSADGSHVFFQTQASLPTAPGTPADTRPGQMQLYERYEEHTYVVGVMPDGSVATCGAEVGDGGHTPVETYDDDRAGAVSPDGSNVVFHTYALSSPGSPECPHFHGFSPRESEVGGLYLREDNGTPQAKTVELPGKFYLGRTADGSTVLSTGGPGGNAEGEPIYEYNVPTGQVTTVGYGALIAYSDDGSVVYYVTHVVESAPYVGGESQLEVYDHGVTKTVHGAGAAYAGGAYDQSLPTLVDFQATDLPVTTPDGSKILFLDRAALTGYDTFGPTCDEQRPGNCSEAYIYDLNNGSFTCVSCNPDGAPPVSDVHLYDNASSLVNLFPPTPTLLSEDGSRAFFQTTEALVPQDTNGANDVYEWEHGHIYLISSGQGGEIGSAGGEGGVSGSGSALVGASSNGDDVFFTTTDRLVPQNEEDSRAIYDARVGGGFPYTPVGHGCDSGQCQGPQTPAPVFAPPASSTFVGIGNPVWETNEPVVKVKKVAHPAKKRKTKKRGRRRDTIGQKAKGRK
jgi:hypothetical protein